MHDLRSGLTARTTANIEDCTRRNGCFFTFRASTAGCRLAGLLMQLRSLLNDLGYARRIAKGLNNLLEIRKRFKDDSLRSHLEMFDEDTALVAI
ncbi:hypothetical protein Brsp06_02499 [Brucella sp. NBRC 13694]|nr:hypothetical protein BG46_20955 [Brucella anthropi]